MMWLIIGGVLIAAAAAVATILVPMQIQRRQEAAFDQARQIFMRRREWLEAKFVTLASQSGKPRGLSWQNCEFEDCVAFARDRSTRSLRALVGVTISFEAVPGGGMEHVEAVGNLRAATAVFSFNGQEWQTDGRAVFNLNPDETIRHYQHELDPIG